MPRPCCFVVAFLQFSYPYDKVVRRRPQLYFNLKFVLFNEIPLYPVLFSRIGYLHKNKIFKDKWQCLCFCLTTTLPWKSILRAEGHSIDY
jgi:hypothetical protein